MDTFKELTTLLKSSPMYVNKYGVIIRLLDGKDSLLLTYAIDSTTNISIAGTYFLFDREYKGYEAIDCNAIYTNRRMFYS